ncbi:MAG: response regulator [Proteobacteria bacterium]|nr:response regulator [Pseudomonadota bacterium]
MQDKTKILVIDDEEIVRLSHRRILAGDRFNVETVLDGSEGLRLLEQHPVDVVLLDLRMPGMDGISVLKTIKEKWPEIEVVVITGYPSIETAKEAIQLGAYDYLAKPADPDDIMKVTRGAVMQKQWGMHKEQAPIGIH